MNITFILAVFFLLFSTTINGYNYVKRIDRGIITVILAVVPFLMAVFMILSRFNYIPIK
jgi:hypothetical protein